MAELRTHVLIDGLGYAESPRWHDGGLWFSDFHSDTVYRADLDATTTTAVATVPGRPAGLGFAPDGTLLVVSAHDHRLMRLTGEGLEQAADLSPYCAGPANDMVVDARGRAYVGEFGYDLIGGEEPRATGLLLIAPDGTASVVAEDLMFPNGMAISADGDTLIVAETNANRLTAFDVADDGRLSRRRVFAAFDDAAPTASASTPRGRYGRDFHSRRSSAALSRAVSSPTASRHRADGRWRARWAGTIVVRSSA